MYEESIKCNEYIPFNYTAYYDEAEEWEETMNNVTCAFLESVQRESTTASSNSYSMAFSAVGSVSGRQLFFVGTTIVGFVGAAIFVFIRRNSKNIGKDLNDALVYGEAP